MRTTVTYSALVKSGRTYLVIVIVALVIHCIYLGAIPGGYLKKCTHDSTIFHKPGADFFAIYEAGWDFVHGRNVYHHEEAAEAIKHSLNTGEQRAPYYTRYRYLPHFAATAGVLLNVFQPYGAYIFWIVLCELILLVNIELTRRFVTSPQRFCWSILFWLAPFPLYLEYWMGQFSFVMASLVFWTIIAFVRYRRTLADTMWTCSVCLKLYSLGFVTLFYRRKWVRDIAVCVGVVCVPAFIYFMFFPAGMSRFFFEL